MFVAGIYIYCPAVTMTLEGLDLLSVESHVMPAIYLNLGFQVVIGQTVEFVSVTVCFPNPPKKRYRRVCKIYGSFFFHVQGPKRILRMHCSLVAYCTRPIIAVTTRELQAAKGGTMCGRETRPIILPRYADFHDTF